MGHLEAACGDIGVEVVVPADLRAQSLEALLLVDVRDAESFARGHARGALNYPKATHRWPTLRRGFRQEVMQRKCIVIDAGGPHDGAEVAALLVQILKRHLGIAVLQGGIQAYWEAQLPFEGTLGATPCAEGPPLRCPPDAFFTEDETPLSEARSLEVGTMVNDAFQAQIGDIPKELRYDSTNVNREVKKLRARGQAEIIDTGVRYRVFCAYEGAVLIGALVLKHSAVSSPSRWAVVKYVASLRKGCGFALQKRTWAFCINTLHLPEVYAGAWLECDGAWRSHVRWGFDFCPFKDWPRGLTYGSGVLGMKKDLREFAMNHHPINSG